MARLRAAGCVFAEDEAELLRAAAGTPAELEALVHRRTRGEPLPHILGWAEFCGLRVAISPDVFIPRVRTELLVREAVALLGSRREATVVDLCCGSGALGAAIATHAAARIQLHAADLDPVAVACARENLARFGGQVHQGDLYAPLPERLRGRVDVLVANVPYVPTRALPMLPELWLHEPLTALDGGDDGLDVLRRLARQAPAWLAPGGHLLVETGRDQAPVACQVLASAGLTPRVVQDPELDATAVIGTRVGRVGA